MLIFPSTPSILSGVLKEDTLTKVNFDANFKVQSAVFAHILTVLARGRRESFTLMGV